MTGKWCVPWNPENRVYFYYWHAKSFLAFCNIIEKKTKYKKQKTSCIVLESERQSRDPGWGVSDLRCFQRYLCFKSGIRRSPVLFSLDLPFQLSLPRYLVLVEILFSQELERVQGWAHHDYRKFNSCYDLWCLSIWIRCKSDWRSQGFNIPSTVLWSHLLSALQFHLMVSRDST